MQTAEILIFAKKVEVKISFSLFIYVNLKKDNKHEHKFKL